MLNIAKKKRLLSWFFDRTGWFWQPLNFASAASVCNGVKQIIFFGVFFYFWVGRYNKTLNDWPLAKQWVLFPLDLNVRLGFASGNIEGLGETKLTGQSLNVNKSSKSSFSVRPISVRLFYSALDIIPGKTKYKEADTSFTCALSQRSVTFFSFSYIACFLTACVHLAEKNFSKRTWHHRNVRKTGYQL